jgi:hypothetical protein
MEYPKDNKEFECLMQERAVAQKLRVRIPSISTTIQWDATADKPLTSDGKRILCEFSKLALGTEFGWVECGQVQDPKYKLDTYSREIFFFDPFRELLDHNNIIAALVFKSVHKSHKKLKEQLQTMGSGSANRNGSFCAAGGGCD